MTKSQFDFIKSFADDELLSSFFCLDVRLFIACQIALESAFGTSELAKTQNNFIGMKKPKKRFGTYISCEDFAFASYFDVASCLSDYICWVLYHRPSNEALYSAATYSSWLSGKYCPDADYIPNITSLYYQFKFNKFCQS